MIKHKKDILIAKMPIDFYYSPSSAPCRSIRMLCKKLGVELNLIRLQLRPAGDHLKPEFLKLNPQHCIPTINDNGFILWESRAILAYIANQYGKDDTLYPKDPKKRALVDQRLYFDMGTFYQRYADYYYPWFLENKPLDPEKMKRFQEAFEFLDKFLESQEYVAGDSFTIADFAIVSSLASAEQADFDMKSYNNVVKYFQKVKKEIDGYDEINTKPLQESKELFLKARAAAATN